MDKHLLAENPMRAREGGLAIIRTVQPVSIYEVIEGHIEHLSKHQHFKLYTFKNSDGIFEDYTLRLHHYFSTDIDMTDESEIFKFMDDAWCWFMAYMKWEDSQ
jgi:hypothetical protein